VHLTRRSALAVRPFEPEDLREAGDISAAAFGFDISDPPLADRWRGRLGHILGTDPDGCFVAERDGRIIGVAEAMIRGPLWCLSLLTVRPDVQGGGAGRLLMDRALRYGAGSAHGLIVASDDPRALRLYGTSGFRLLPTFEAEGAVDRRALPAPDPRVRRGGLRDLEALVRISEAVRGAPHTSELEFALGREGVLLRFADRGFAVSQPGHGVWLLAALDDEAATALLWHALDLVGATNRPGIRWLTGDQDWAIEVLLRAGLRLRASGALCVRGAPGPLRPYLPSPPFA
jgi:ribosomal protein S18 acetylase RimI-like enzyme